MVLRRKFNDILVSRNESKEQINNLASSQRKKDKIKSRLNKLNNLIMSNSKEKDSAFTNNQMRFMHINKFKNEVNSSKTIDTKNQEIISNIFDTR